MKASRPLFICLAVLILGVSVVPAQSLTTVYSHDFESSVGSEWTQSNRATTPTGLRTFLGRFSGEPVGLLLDDLDEHCSVTVSFELFIIGSWEGSVGYYAGADIWDLNAASPTSGCPEQNLLHATFANCECRYQSYPNTFPDVHHPGYTRADEVDTLGYEDDTVYYLSFTFFHDEPELELTFAGSPMLQGIDDESWGIDNIVVEMDTNQTNCCRATRALPIAWGGGVSADVKIDVNPNPRAEAYVVEETPPADWTVSDINDGGVYEEATGMIKWGPFFDDIGRTLSYSALHQTGAWGTQSFDGTMYVDGDDEPICGDTLMAMGANHPADVDTDWDIDGNEYTAYAAAWKNGDLWPTGPNPIPGDYVTNAGVIYKSGGGYVFLANVDPPWSPDNPKIGVVGAAMSDFGTNEFRMGRSFDVVLTLTPDAGTEASLVVETPPVGWAVSEISNNGIWDAESRMIKWGPFYDDVERILSYKATPVQTAGEHEATFIGSASFDGAGTLIAGDRSIAAADEVVMSPSTISLY